MKSKQSFASIIVFAVISALSAIFLISQFSEKTDNNTDFVTDDSNSSANHVKNDLDLKPRKEHERKLNEFSVSANSNLSKFQNLEKSLTQNLISLSEFVRDLCLIIENIEEIESKFRDDSNIIDTKTYEDFAKLRIQARQTFFAQYAAFLNDTVKFYCYWWEIDKARKFLLDEKSSTVRYIPSSLVNDPELIKILAQTEEKINDFAEKLEKFSDKTIQFAQNTLAMINEIESSNFADKKLLIEKITDWQKTFTLLMPIITDVERDALLPRIKNAFYALEFAYFKSPDALKTDADVDFAIKFFPFSHQMFQQIQDKFDKKYSKKLRLLNKAFNVYEIFRQRFYKGFGLMNSNISFSINDTKFNEMLLFIGYLVFFTNHFALDKTNNELLTLVNHWIASINSTVERTLAMTSTEDIDKKIRNEIYKTHYLSTLKTVEQVKEIRCLSSIIVKIDDELKNSTLETLIKNPKISFFDFVKLFTDSVAFNTGKITDMLHQAVIDKLIIELLSIQLFNDEAQKNAEYIEIFAEIDELFAILKYLKYPAQMEMSLEIAKIIESVSQKDVITAIIEDKNSINAIISKLDEPTSPVFIEFITNLYNRLLLTRKGTENIDQAFINANLLVLKVFSKAYMKLAEMLKTSTPTSITDVFIFCKIYNQISKFSFIDQFLKDKNLYRTTIINSVKYKYNNQLSILTDFESLLILKSLYNSITETKSWSELLHLKKIKSQIVNLVIKNRENHLVFNGILLAEVLLENKFFELLMKNWKVKPNEIWIDHAKWFTRNFSLNSSHKNSIDEKIKTLINK